MEVSVIVPVYNSELYIEECINSILQQSFDDIEVVIVDDGSTDKTAEICNNISQKNENVLYYKKENSGVSSARNKGIELSSGKYLAFVDSDDIIHKDMIRLLYKSIQNVDISVCGYCLYENKTNNVIEKFGRDFCGSYADFFDNFNCFISPPLVLGPCFKLIKKEIVIEHDVIFPEDISYGEDALFVLEYLKYCERISVISDCLYYYRQHGNKTLCKMYREDKMIIKKRIYDKMVELGGNRVKLAAEEWFINSFDGYIHELVASDMKYSKKKDHFYNNAKQIDILKMYSGYKKLTSLKRIVSFCVKTRIFFPLYCAVSIHDYNN